MNAYLEEQIVKGFMKKQYQERALYMLNSKKRDRFLFGLTRDHFIDQYLHPIPLKNNTVHQLIMTLKSLSNQDKYYLMVPGTFDTENATLETVLLTLFGFGPFILFFMNCGFCYFEEEQAHGAPGRFILWKKKEKPF